MPPVPDPIVRVSRALFDRARAVEGIRVVPEETPVAFTYNQATYAVMMASPSDLEDFAVGLSLTERIIERADNITTTEVLALTNGIELRMTLAAERGAAFDTRRRRFAGLAGCGLCGIESLEAATAAPPHVESVLRVNAATVFEAVRGLRDYQRLNAETRAVHAAGFWPPSAKQFAAVREDVGRHNALDKLIGALARGHVDAREGFVVMTSRLSIELIQKTAIAGCPILIAVSAPTAFAIREAAAAGMTIVGIARDDSFEVFTHPQRIVS